MLGIYIPLPARHVRQGVLPADLNRYRHASTYGKIECENYQLDHLVVRLVFLSAALGSFPVAVRIFEYSLSSAILITTGFLCLTAIIVRFRLPRLWAHVFWPLLAMCVIAAAWRVSGQGLSSVDLFVWVCIPLVALVVSTSRAQPELLLRELDTLVDFAFWILILVLAVSWAVRGQDSATAQVGVLFFACYVARLHEQPKKAFSRLLVLLVLQAAISARIVIAAELIMFALLPLLSRVQGVSKRRSASTLSKSTLTWVGALSVITVVGIVGVLDKSLGSGDSGLSVAGYDINTSGRMYWWGVVLESAADSLWLGHGTPGPYEMLETESWSHPHNDYLRLLHQLGAVGLGCWLLFVVRAARLAYHGIKGAADPNARRWSLIGFLLVAGLSVLMLTDNTIVYSYVILPVAAVLGVLIKLSSANRAAGIYVR